MTALHGIVTASGAAVRAGAVTLPLPKTRTPLGEAVAALVAAIDAGELLPCRHCGAYGGCDCEEWGAAMQPSADPHGDLSAWQDCEIPY